MRVYSLSHKQLQTSLPKPLTRFVVSCAIYGPVIFAVVFTVGRIWPSPHGEPSIGALLTKTFISTIFYAALMFIFKPPSKEEKLLGFDIYVDEKEIRAGNRIAHRGQIRTISERKYSLVISDRTWIETFLWGGIHIPKMLPEYEELKALATSWKHAPQ